MDFKLEKTVVLYLVGGITWILLGDYISHVLLAVDGIDVRLLEIIKGLSFVAFTAFLLNFGIKRQNKRLFSSEKKYRQLFYSNPNPMWIYQKGTLRFLEVNDAAIHAYGYSREEFKEMTILDIRPLEDREFVFEAASRMENYHPETQWRHLKKSGDEIIVAITSHELKSDGMDCVLVLAQDQTVRVTQEQMLKQLYDTEKGLKEELEQNVKLLEQSLAEKQKLAEVVDRVNNIVIITDTMGKISWVNESFIKFTGYSSEEVVGQYTDILHGPGTDPDIQMQIMESLKKEELRSFEILNYTKSGQEYWIEITISPIYDDGVIVRYIAIQNIITERKKKEEEVKRQNLVLRKHAWTNSHAFRKPVASILSLMQLRTECSTQDELDEIYSLIEKSTAELEEITRNISKELNECEIELNAEPRKSA